MNTVINKQKEKKVNTVIQCGSFFGFLFFFLTLQQGSDIRFFQSEFSLVGSRRFFRFFLTSFDNI